MENLQEGRLVANRFRFGTVSNHLFRRYAETGGRDGARDPAGFGLGLVICKGLVEAHGGRIRAESPGTGLGTRFTFTLPVAGEVAELTARVRAALRRRAGAEPFVLGDLSIDYEQRRVTVAGRAVRLTPIEYELLRVLSLNAGRVMPYASLLCQVWGNGNGDAAPVRDFVKKLRRKLGDDPADPAWIVNERGVGYRMRRPEET